MKKAFIISLAIAMLEFAAAAILYRYLPEKVPIRWNASGISAAFGDRINIFAAPVLSLLLTVGFRVLPHLIPKGDNIEKSGKIYPNLMVLMNLMMVLLLVVMATTAFRLRTPVNILLLISMGIVMMYLGNYLPKVKLNYAFGICLPWTLSNEFVWIKTHRFGGRIWFGAGVLCLIGVFIPAPLNFIIPLAGLYVGLVAITVYAHRVHKKNQQENL
jgi:uncharacterized membrane protein